MKPLSKIFLIVVVLMFLNWYYGFDAKFTIINLTWCIPIAFDFVKQKKNE